MVEAENKLELKNVDDLSPQNSNLISDHGEEYLGEDYMEHMEFITR